MKKIHWGEREAIKAYKKTPTDKYNILHHAYIRSTNLTHSKDYISVG